MDNSQTLLELDFRNRTGAGGLNKLGDLVEDLSRVLEVMSGKEMIFFRVSSSGVEELDCDFSEAFLTAEAKMELNFRSHISSVFSPDGVSR